MWRLLYHLSAMAGTLGILSGLWGCQLSPYPPLTGNDRSYTDSIIQGRDFRHFVRHSFIGDDVLHIYIEGDGRPWVTPLLKARDPTPRRALAHELMLSDTESVLYLGRPCYFETEDPACHQQSQWWTGKRYAEEIVTSLNSVIDRFAGEFREIHLIGYSGGGVLAYLIAARRADIQRLVTIAANLDIDAWVHLHNFSPLSGSLNPTEFDGVSAQQLHLVGARDQRVPAAIFPEIIRSRPHVEVRVISGFRHDCCWRKLWPQIAYPD